MNALNDENANLSLVEEKVQHLIKKVGVASGALALLALLIGFVGWRLFWLGIPLGLAIGFGSFFILAQTVNTLTAPTKIRAMMMVVFSSLKLLLLLVTLWILYKLGFDMLQLLAGLFMSQVAVFSGIVLTFHRGQTPPAEAR